MAEKITDEQVSDLVAILRTDASIDAKVQQVTAIKSGIKQHNVPDSCVAPVFEALRTASSSQHAALVSAGFTALNHLLTRLSRQEPKYIAKEAPRTLALVVEKLGDPKEKLRSLAAQCLTTIYAAAPMDAERSVRNTAMIGKNSRAKEASMQWLLQMNQESSLQFRTYVPVLMELLEDADGMVRDVAKTTVVELFRNAPNVAKSDLKKQLKIFKVRPAIEQAIVRELVPTAGTARPETPADPAPRPNLAASVSSLSSERPITPMPDAKPDAVEPSYVNTQRELDDIFRDMRQHFEGRETEQNWLKREESMTKLRRLIAGNATDYLEPFLAGVRSLLDGIIKASTSLRTSLSKEGCSLIQDLAATFGPGMDPMVELLMQTLIKLCGGTKKISSQQANTTVNTIIGRVSYTSRIMQHVWGACQDKNVQPRLYATGWLRTIIDKEAHHKNHLEHSGGLDLIEKGIKKGLNDPNPGVREKMRSTYWAFAGIWPARAEAIMDSLDPTAQKLLNKDPNNPNSPKKDTVRPGLGLSKSTMGSAKPSLREALLAQKKAALASRNLPARPGSAMAHFSPVRTVSNSSAASATSASAVPPTRSRPESTIAVNSGGMSVAPMRPTKRRPELAARPATAGPYSVRSHDQASAEAASPSDGARLKGVTPKPTQASPRRTAPRARPGHATHASEPSVPSPVRAALTKAASSGSPRGNPARARVAQTTTASNSPSNSNEEFTLIVPSLIHMRSSPPTQAPRPLPSPVLENAAELDERTPTRPLMVYEDPFSDDNSTPKQTFVGSVLEDKPVNEIAASVPAANGENGLADPPLSPEKSKQNIRLLESGVTRVKAKTLDVHGFRKLQSLIRENKAVFTDDKFEALLTGLFQYLEDPLSSLAPEKAQDVKAQILATIKLLLKKERDNFQPHIARALESLLATRSAYDARTHIVSGLELLADELVTIGDPPELVMTMTKLLRNRSDSSVDGCRCLSMGLHVLKEMLDKRTSYMPTDTELAQLTALASHCLDSAESGVRMDAVQLCVAMHARVGDPRFWEATKGVKEDPKSLITYYIVKRQREAGAS